MRSLFASLGGKSWLIKKLVPMLSGKIYVEPYIGGGAIFWDVVEKKMFEKYVISDIDYRVYSIYKAVRDNVDDLLNRKWIRDRWTFWSLYKGRFQKFKNYVDEAYRWLYLAKAGVYSGFTLGNNFDYSKEGTVPEVVKKLKKYSELLQGVEIRDQNALEVIKEFNSPETCFYLDPPYTIAIRRKWYGLECKDFYEGKGGEEEPKDLAELLKKVKGKWFLSYNLDPEVLEAFSWAKYELLDDIVPKYVSGCKQKEILIYG